MIPTIRYSGKSRAMGLVKSSVCHRLGRKEGLICRAQRIFSYYNAQLGLTTSLKGFWTSWVGVYGVGSDGVVEES